MCVRVFDHMCDDLEWWGMVRGEGLSMSRTWIVSPRVDCAISDDFGVNLQHSILGVISPLQRCHSLMRAL